MEITKDNIGKWIYPAYDKYLTQSSATDDKDKVIVKQVYIPLEESNDDWVEITAEDVKRIRGAKGQSVSVEIPEEINTQLELTSVLINTIELTDAQPLQFKSLYPKWESFINSKLEKDYKVLYNNKLYKVRQTIETVLENQPPSIETAALYEEINETNAGTKEDPIPYNNNMELFEGKYYSQSGVIYKCTRNTEQAVYNNLSDLVGLYVEIAE